MKHNDKKLGLASVVSISVGLIVATSCHVSIQTSHLTTLLPSNPSKNQTETPKFSVRIPTCKY